MGILPQAAASQGELQAKTFNRKLLRHLVLLKSTVIVFPSDLKLFHQTKFALSPKRCRERNFGSSDWQWWWWCSNTVERWVQPPGLPLFSPWASPHYLCDGSWSISLLIPLWQGAEQYRRDKRKGYERISFFSCNTYSYPFIIHSPTSDSVFPLLQKSAYLTQSSECCLSLPIFEVPMCTLSLPVVQSLPLGFSKCWEDTVMALWNWVPQWSHSGGPSWRWGWFWAVTEELVLEEAWNSYA